MKDLAELVRPNLWSLAPYSCARNEFQGVARVLLDANENPYNSPLNRYPAPLQRHLQSLIAPVKGTIEVKADKKQAVLSDQLPPMSFRIYRIKK